ncbi:hypothetical protein B0181_08445 [Moraxella caviae]|uniref:UPF0761 membrane protein B0181_08445 n=1 Tax=Moraxella caviae TaxID=34060 RepID=A0A1S9ZXS5_9GAMM|nr:YhjD/YihY/BrkB family envelope integrity protein [Moraxella caviae]OOR88260.1 hypothetical protein B0181_08445 [Moraxella caviae]STZ13904.1 ribonuclease BN/uncharacterised domain fusion protein [Moraxella caviae]
MTSLLQKLPFYQKPWFVYLRTVVQHFIDDDCPQKAASLTYTTLLSIVPILTVVIVIFSSIPALQDVREQMQQMIYGFLLPSSGEQMGHYFQTFAEKSSNLGIVGVIGLFVTTIMTLITIETAFNHIWRVKDRSGGAASFVRYWTMITLGPIVLGVAFGASSTISSMNFLNQQIAGYGIDWSAWAYVVSLAITAAGFIGMYWFIPKVQVPLKNAAIAGVVAAALFETLKMVFGTVMRDFTSYEAIYGAFAAVPIFLLWIYLSWNIILLGVEISYTLTVFDAKKSAVRHPMLSLLDMLNLTYTRYQNGKTVSESELRAVLGRKELPKWSEYIAKLTDNELITRTKDNQYVLKTDLNSVSLWQFYKSLPYPLPIKDELDHAAIAITAEKSTWLHALYEQFLRIENTAKSELNITLAQVFRGETDLKNNKTASENTDNATLDGTNLSNANLNNHTADERLNSTIATPANHQTATQTAQDNDAQNAENLADNVRGDEIFNTENHAHTDSLYDQNHQDNLQKLSDKSGDKFNGKFGSEFSGEFGDKVRSTSQKLKADLGEFGDEVGKKARQLLDKFKKS